MSLGSEQKAFTRDVSLLVAWAYENGYELTFGDAYRSPRVFGMMGVSKGYGNRNSNHKLRLAIDFNLFKDGEYMTASDDHAALGEYWESLHPHNRWGGRYEDGNHYERVRNGWRT